MSGPFTIRRMRDQDELKVALDWAEREGWNPGRYDAQCFFTADPAGFFIGEQDNRTVAVGSAVIYDRDFAFCGLYIVEPEFRGLGHGLELTRARLQYVGERNAGIDGVIENIPIYERIGYRLAYRNYRYCGTASKPETESPNLFPLFEIQFSEIETYDRQCFPATRTRFLKFWINQPESLALGYVENSRLRGFAVRRRCIEGHKIGPLFADNLELADQLLTGLMRGIEGEVVFLDIPEINPDAERLVRQHDMQQVFATGRMYLKGKPDMDYAKLFGITTFELG